MRLSYYIHPGHGKYILVSHGDRTWVLPNVSRQLYLWIRALTVAIGLYNLSVVTSAHSVSIL